MKRYYRNRIMLSAMLSFMIILVIAVAGIWLFSYQRIERNTDSLFLSPTSVVTTDASIPYGICTTVYAIPNST